MTAKVTPAMIRELRERTGIGMTTCKQALEKASGDMELAIDNLRKAGMAAAVKKEGRETKEGLIGFFDGGDTIGFVEVMAETDFVVNNERFREFLANLAEEAATTKPASLEAFLQQPYSKSNGNGMTVEEYRASVVQTVGENILVRRVKALTKEADKSLGIYMHLGGKIGCIVEVTGSGDEQQFAKDIAMHVAAAAPEFLDVESVPADAVDREKEIVRAQVQNKPENIIDKIVEGKMRAFFNDNCLLNQKFIRDDSVTVAGLIAQRSKETGQALAVSSFLRWQVGKR